MPAPTANPAGRLSHEWSTRPFPLRSKAALFGCTLTGSRQNAGCDKPGARKVRRYRLPGSTSDAARELESSSRRAEPGRAEGHPENYRISGGLRVPQRARGFPSRTHIPQASGSRPAPDEIVRRAPTILSGLPTPMSCSLQFPCNEVLSRAFRGPRSVGSTRAVIWLFDAPWALSSFINNHVPRVRAPCGTRSRGRRAFRHRQGQRPIQVVPPLETSSGRKGSAERSSSEVAPRSRAG